MLEFNQWFFVLVVNFLVLFFILKSFLFEPLHKLMKERDISVKTALQNAKDLTSQKEEAFAKMKTELQSAQVEAKKIFDEFRSEGQLLQKEIMSKAEAEAVEMVLQARKDILAEAERARLALRSDIDRFSEEIVKKLVKV